MALIFNGTTVDDVRFNGTTVTEVIFNGTSVWTSVTQTVTPEINGEYCADISGSRYLRWYVRNKDTTTATIFSETSDSTPDINRGTVAYNVNTSLIQQGPFASGQTITIYATASKGGTYNHADISSFDSASVGTTLCQSV